MSLRRFALFCFAAMPLLAQRDVPIENDQVRVVLVTDPQNSKTKMHEHAMNRVMIYLDPGSQRLTYQDGRVENLKFKGGDARWSPVVGMHTSENLGKPYRIVEVELKSLKAPASPAELGPRDTVRVAPNIYKVVLENPQVRVVEVNIPPKGKVPLHEHSMNRVVVYRTDYHLRVTPDGAKPVESTGKAGEIHWGVKNKHQEENLRDTPVQLVVVELK